MREARPPTVLQPMRAIQSAQSLLFSYLQQQPSVHYPCWRQAHLLSFEVIGDDFAVTAAGLFRCYFPFESWRGDYFRGHIEHLPTLHETVHTREKRWIALVLHLHFSSFCCSFTGFETKLYGHSFTTGLHVSTLLLRNLKQECTSELLCSRWCNFARNKFRHNSNQFQQWQMDSTGRILWKKISPKALQARCVCGKMLVSVCT